MFVLRTKNALRADTNCLPPTLLNLPHQKVETGWAVMLRGFRRELAEYLRGTGGKLWTTPID